MHSMGYILENETHKLFLDSEKQTDHQTSAKQPNLVIVKKWQTLPSQQTTL